MIARSPPRSREENERRSLRRAQFPLDVVGIIISQLINVHIIISEDAGSGWDEAGEKGCSARRRRERERGIQVQLCIDMPRPPPCLLQVLLRLGIIEEINCAWSLRDCNPFPANALQPLSRSSRVNPFSSRYIIRDESQERMSHAFFLSYISLFVFINPCVWSFIRARISSHIYIYICAICTIVAVDWHARANRKCARPINYQCLNMCKWQIYLWIRFTYVYIHVILYK